MCRRLLRAIRYSGEPAASLATSAKRKQIQSINGSAAGYCGLMDGIAVDVFKPRLGSIPARKQMHAR
jgi:hypothetical protein